MTKEQEAQQAQTGNRTILLKCRICGDTKVVSREKYDPAKAVTCESVCGKHENDCPETFYYDRHGNEVSGDTELK